MSGCSGDCSTCSSSCEDKSKKKESFLEAPHELSNIKKVIGIVSGKGGVGKSLVTSLSAVEMKRRGYKTAVLDADITGPSIPRMFGVHERVQGYDGGMFPAASKTGIEIMSVNLLLDNETDPVVWRGPVIAGVVKQFWKEVVWNDVDFMFVDMPPGTGDVPLTVFQSLPVDGIIIVTSPQELVSMIVEKAANMAKMMDIPVLGIIENMSYVQCPDCSKRIYVYGESHIDEIAEKHGFPVLAKMPINPKLAAACDAGVIELFEGDWLEPLAVKLEDLL